MDPAAIEIHTGNDHASGLLQTPLLHTIANLPVVDGESTYTLCASHSEHSVKITSQGKQSEELASIGVD